MWKGDDEDDSDDDETTYAPFISFAVYETVWLSHTTAAYDNVTCLGMSVFLSVTQMSTSTIIVRLALCVSQFSFCLSLSPLSLSLYLYLSIYLSVAFSLSLIFFLLCNDSAGLHPLFFVPIFRSLFSITIIIQLSIYFLAGSLLTPHHSSLDRQIL